MYQEYFLFTSVSDSDTVIGNLMLLATDYDHVIDGRTISSLSGVMEFLIQSICD